MQSTALIFSGVLNSYLITSSIILRQVHPSFILERNSRSIMVSSNINWTVSSSANWIATNLNSGTGDGQLDITIDANQENNNRSGTLTISGGSQSVTIDVFQDPSEVLDVQNNLEREVLLFPNPTDGRIKLNDLPSGSYSSHLEGIDVDGRSVFSEEYRIDNNKLVIDLNKLIPGAYLLNVNFMNQNGKPYSELTRKYVRN